MAENTGLVFKMYTDLTNYSKGLKKAGNELDSFNKHMGKVGGMIAGAFSVAAIASFTKEVVNLAAEAEPVQKAFERIGGGQYLDAMREATRGTVTDLELMKRAVAANNFQIPLESLAGLFEFARRRAEETGQSVDYLVDSIVTGIGRKSPLILDNLGISAVALKEKLGGVSTEAASIGDVAKAVGSIAQSELVKMGTESVTTGQQLASITTEWQNVKLEIGKAIIESKLFRDAIDLIKGSLENFTSRNASTKAKGLLLVGTDTVKDIETANKLLSDISKTRQQLNSQDNSWWDRFFNTRKASEARDLNNALNPLYQTLMKYVQDWNEISGMIALKPDETTTSGSDPVDNGKKIIGIYSKLNEKIKAYKEQIDATYSESVIRVIREKVKLLELEKQYYDSIGTSLKKMTAKGAGLISNPTNAGTMKLRSGAGAVNLGSADDAPSIVELAEMAAGASDMLSNFRSDILATAAEGFGLLITGDMGLGEFFNSVLMMTADFAKQFGKLLIEIGLAKISLEKLGVSGIGAVIAGAALIAAAGAIGALLSKGPDMPGLATGTNYVPNDGPYYLHKGESVVPKKYNPANGGMMPATINVVGNISGRNIRLTQARETLYNNLTGR
jgi:hypothetical protein